MKAEDLQSHLQSFEISDYTSGSTCDIAKAIARADSFVPKDTVVAFKSPIDLTSLDRLIREYDMLSRVKSDNIIGCYCEKPEDILVLEFFEKHLADYRCDSNYQPGNNDFIVRAVGKGLSDMHSQEILHRALHPRKIMIQEEKVKIAGFGSAGTPDDDSNLGRIVPIVRVPGVAKFMATESIKDDIYTIQSDIYSFGMIIIYLETRGTPFDESANLTELVKIKGNRSNIKDYIQNAFSDSNRQEALCRAVDKDPRKRPESVDELLHQYFSKALVTIPQSAQKGPVQLPNHPNRQTIRNSLAAALICALGAAAYVSWPHLKPEVAQHFYDKGIQHYNSKDWNGALKDFQRAHKFEENNSQYNYALGDTYYELRRFEQAEVYLNRALQLDPDYVSAERKINKIQIAMELQKMQEVLNQKK